MEPNHSTITFTLVSGLHICLPYTDAARKAFRQWVDQPEAWTVSLDDGRGQIWNFRLRDVVAVCES